MGPIVFIFTLIFLAIASVIPAFVAKLLMQGIFGRRVSFGMVLLMTVAGVVFLTLVYFGLMFYSEGTLDLQAFPRFAASISPAENALLYLLGFMLQLVLLTVAVPDENMQLISGRRWAVVLVLQYVILFAIMIGLALVTASAGTAAETPQILTRVV